MPVVVVVGTQPAHQPVPKLLVVSVVADRLHSTQKLQAWELRAHLARVVAVVVGHTVMV
jgi:hypothetical protein